MLQNKTAVVTGGASGIGRAISLKFAANGANIVVADIREDPRSGGERTHELVRSQHHTDSTYINCDVQKIDDIRNAVEAALDLGGIDIMVNNAGIGGITDLFYVTEEKYDRVMNTNVKGTFFASQIAAREMVKNGKGSIINMSSTAGIRGNSASVEYCASKGAVRLLTYSLAARLGPEGVRVNALHPGTTMTELIKSDAGFIGDEMEQELLETIPLNEFADPCDVANAALSLASDMADYITGISLPIDGGRTSTY